MKQENETALLAESTVIRTTRQALEAIVAEVHAEGWKNIDCGPELESKLRARFYHARRMRRVTGFNDWDDINIISRGDAGVRFELNSLTQIARGGGTNEGPKAA